MLPLSVRTTTAAVVLTGLIGASPALASQPALALKRVLLSTGGVGYFEYEAKVSGSADLLLEVRRDRVDDVLKSIVVYDDTGGIGTISLPGREPLRERFRELPFGPEALESPLALLTALRGAEVALSGPHPLTGRLISVTEEQAHLPGDGGTITRHRLALNTGEGLRQAILEDIDTVRFTDPSLQAQVDSALLALAKHSERERRTLTLHTVAPAGPPTERTVHVAYVVEAPLWKTAYRLTLDHAPANQGGLQGWAVLENLSGEDWTDVDLTVISGNPVTFRQALYDAYTVTRPEVPVEVLGRVLPRVDQGAVPQAPPPALEETAPRRAMTRGLNLGGAELFAAAPPPPAPPAPTPAASSRPADITAAESSEATTQVSFHHPGPISVANGHSLLLPIVNHPMAAVRLALYQPGTQPHHPLAAVRLTNDGTSGLPPGILTLYERAADGTVSYVGDARLAALPIGQDRLLSFAIDTKVTINRSERQSQTLTQVRIADGVLQATTTERATTTYTLAGAAVELRRVVIEHPRRSGWELAPGTLAVETTADAYRLIADVPAGKTVTVTVATERPRLERFELTGLALERIDVFVQAPEVPEAVRKALSQVGEAQAAVTQRERTVAHLDHALADVTEDQRRLRDNLQAVGQGSDLSRRYLAKLGQQEDRLDTLNQERAQAQTALETARQALGDRIKGLKF